MVARNTTVARQAVATNIPQSSSNASVSSSKSVNRTSKKDDCAVELKYSPYPKIDQAIANMKLGLGRYTRANDRRMVLRTLKENKYWKALPVEPRTPPMVELEELEMEVAKENLILNGQTFQRQTKYGRTSTDFLHVLHELCYQLCENGTCPANSGESKSAISPDTLYYDLLCRLARTITSADAFAKLNDILGNNDLVLMNATAERKMTKNPKSNISVVVKSNSSNKRCADVSGNPPIEVNIFEEGGSIHAHIVTVLGYGLYRKTDVNVGRPWIKMQAELVERSNFTSGAQIRHVTVHWPDMYV